MATIFCDGCGQPSDQEHIARRLKRLEKMTRYRPVHVQTLLLGAVMPDAERDFLYCADGRFSGEGAQIMDPPGSTSALQTIEERLTAFQRRGFLLAYVLECAVSGSAERQQAMERRLPAVLARIRRSYKPKRVVLAGPELSAHVTAITAADLGAAVVLHEGKPFEWPQVRELLSGALAAKDATAGQNAL